MVDGRTGGARVPQSTCLHSEARGVCEARGAMSRRSRSRRRTAAHRDRRRLSSRLLGWLLIPFGGRTGDAGSRLGRSMSTTHFARAEAVVHLQRSQDERVWTVNQGQVGS
jgi:hypothetical protein